MERSHIRQWRFLGSFVGVFLRSVVRVVPCPPSLNTGQTSSLPVRYPQRPLQFYSIFNLPAAFSPAGRSFLTTNPHETQLSLQKKIKVHFFFATIRTCLFFSFSFFSFSLCCRMSKSSTATAPKNPTPLPAKSAWSRGPPQSTTAPSPRSQSPAPPTPVLQTHSRRPSTLGQGIPIKDGVSIPRNNVGAVKQGLSSSSISQLDQNFKSYFTISRLGGDLWINR